MHLTSRTEWALVALVLSAVSAVTVALVRPATVVHDWHGWRQADTQTIAFNYAVGELAPLRPQIAWGGDGPGFVEAELQVYTAALTLLLRATGAEEPMDGEWLGRALSAAALLVAALLVWAWLRRELELGPGAALTGALAFSTSTGAVFLVSVQPDALGLAATTGALVLFARWLRTGRVSQLLGAALLLALGASVKPTFLAAGVAQAILVVAVARERLREARLWLAWGLALGLVGLVLLNGAHVHATWGNTFGVVSGGDSKFPTWDRLTPPMQYVGLAVTGLEFGPGPLGTLGLALVLWRWRRLPWAGVATTLALWGAYALTGVVAMRYASEAWLGSHYHALGLLAGAVGLGVGLSTADRRDEGASAPRHVQRLVPLVLSAFCLVQFGLAIRSRGGAAEGWASAELAVGAALRREVDAAGLTRPGAPLQERPLVVIRSGVASTTDTGAPNNFEDPRVFYLAGVRGWVLPADSGDLVASLPDLVARGARYYVDPTDWLAEHPDDGAWLGTHADPVAPGIFRLQRTSGRGVGITDVAR